MSRNNLIQFRKGTFADFTGVNPILASGEPGYAIDTKTLKIGDGTTAWNSLSSISGLGIDNIVEDTTPQLGGNLDVNTKNISGVGNIAIIGNVDVTGNLDVDGTGTFTRIGIGTDGPTVGLQVEQNNITFNDGGGDFDFRVEGDSDQNLFFTDASRDGIGIGTNNPGGNKVRIHSSGTYNSENTSAIKIDDGTSVMGGLLGADPVANVFYVQSVDPGTSYGTKSLALNPNSSGMTNPGSVGIGTTNPTRNLTHCGTTALIASGSAYELDISASAATLGLNRLQLLGTETVFNNAGSNFDFRVEGDTDQYLIFVDASTDRVGIGTGVPAYKLDVNGMGRFVHADGMCGIQVEDSGGSGVHIGDCAYSHGASYAGMKHSNHSGSKEFMIMSQGANTYLTGGSGYGVIINGNPAGGYASSEIRVYDATAGNDGVVINEQGQDIDTRIEGLNDENLFKVDASTDRIGIGTSSPAHQLHVTGDAQFNKIEIGSQAYSVGAAQGITHTGITSASGYMLISDGTHTFTSCASGGFNYVRGPENNTTYQMVVGDSKMFIGTTTTEKMTVYSNRTVFNEDGNNYDFRVEASGSPNAIFVEGSNGNVGIGTDAPQTLVDVSGTVTASGGNSTQWNTAYGWGDHSTSGYLINIVEDTSPQLGGNLDLNSNDITGTGDFNIIGSGVITETMDNHCGFIIKSSGDTNGELHIGSCADSAGVGNAMGLRHSSGMGANDYIIMANTDGATFVSAKDTKTLTLSAGGHDADSKLEIRDSSLGFRFNVNKSNVDLQYNGDNENNVFYIDASADSVGIGTDSPQTRLDVSGTITASGGNSTQWNTAYGWGDHSTVGYIDGSGSGDYIPIFSDSNTLTNSIINQSGNTLGINDIASGGNITLHAHGINNTGSWIINENAQGNSTYNTVFEARESGTRLGAMYSYGTAYSGGSLASVGSGGTAFASITGPVAIGPLDSTKDLIFGAGTAQYAKMTSSEFRINHSGLNRDFRVEGDSDQDLIVADASADKVGIGTGSPSSKLHVMDNSITGSIHDMIASGTMNSTTMQVYAENESDTNESPGGFSFSSNKSNGTTCGAALTASSPKDGYGWSPDIILSARSNIPYGGSTWAKRLVVTSRGRVSIPDARNGDGGDEGEYKFAVRDSASGVVSGLFAVKAGDDGFGTYITASGTGVVSLGLGTDSPSGLLHTKAPDNASNLFIQEGSRASGSAQFLQKTHGYTSAGGLISYATGYTAGSLASVGAGGAALTNMGEFPLAIAPLYTTQPILFGAGNNEYMRLSSGNLGIGVDPNLFIEDMPSHHPSLVLGDGDGHTSQTFYSATGSAGIIYFADGTGDAQHAAGYIQYTHSEDHMQFAVNQLVRMRINSVGDVGIGTGTPEYKLDVNGSGRFRCAPTGVGLSVVNANNSGLLFGEIAYQSYGGSYANELYNGMTHTALSGEQEYMILSRGDDTYISAKDGSASIIRGGNNNQTYQFTVSPSYLSVGQFAEKMKFDSSKVEFNVSGQNLDFQVNGTSNNLFYVDASADSVGIGTATPLHPLHVVGTGRINSLNVNGAYTFPTGDGTAGHSLVTDGAGNIVFSGVTGGTTNTAGTGLALDGTEFNVSGIDTSLLVGTITNAQLAGSIANAKLSNSSVNYGGISLALGGSDLTPAFNLVDATGYPTSSLVGTISNAQLAGSIANAKLANSAVTINAGTGLTNGGAVSLGGSVNVDIDETVLTTGTLNTKLQAGSGINLVYSTGDSTLTIHSTGTGVDGDITAVTAGTGLSGGGTTGAVTLNVVSATTSVTGIVKLTNTINGDQDKALTPKAVNDAGYLTAHPNITSVSSSDNSGRTYIQDILLDSNGHVTGIATAAETVTDTNTFTTGIVFNTGNKSLVLNRDGGSVTGTLTNVLVSGNNISLLNNDASYLTAHPNISAASSSDNSSSTFIQDILLDSNGHVTGLATATAGGGGTDTFTTGIVFNTGDKTLVLNRSGGSVTGTLTNILVSGQNVGLLNNDAGYLSNIVADTSPQLGGDLDLNDKNITGAGKININGTGTFTYFDGTCGLMVQDGGGSGIHIGDCALSGNAGYAGIKHSSMAGNTDYMMVSDGDDTYISAKDGQSVFIRGGGNAAQAEIRIHDVGAGGVGIVFNEAGSDRDIRMEGANDVNLFRLDASTDRIGIGTNAPATKLDVDGTITASGGEVLTTGTLNTKLQAASGINLTYNSSQSSLEIATSGQILANMSGAPANSTAAGSMGDLRFDSSYVYIAIGNNHWRRIAHSSF